MTSAEYRQAIIDGIAALDLGTFATTQMQPWDQQGTPLYIRNPKVFYVSQPESTQTAAFNLLNSGCGGQIANKVTSISVFVLVDAKQQPSNFDSLVDQVQTVKDSAAITAVTSRECDVVSTFENDTLLTEFVFRFTELKFN